MKKLQDERLCVFCSKPIKGRADKRFCNEYCRNNYNNQLNSNENNLVRNINNILRKNRRILKSFIPEKEEIYKISREKLILEGFNFTYFTHLYHTQKQQTYFFIYEYGYLLLPEDKILIVKRQGKS